MGKSEWIMLLDGGLTTLWISLSAILIGIVIGLFIALIRNLKIPVITQCLAFYVSLARATPLVTIVLFVFLGMPELGLELDRITTAIIALTINTSAFNAEIWRSAFLSFPREQLEAAKAAGMTRWLTFRRITLPQMFLTSLPALVNEMTFLIKASPAIAVIGVVDLTRVTNQISAVTYEPLPPILVACAMYMLLMGVMLKLQRWSERFVYRLSM
ncbi:ABC transporter permease [Chelonobacter oris]|uniref:ABC transporter permease n=2 Tax=Chelonobacter oris TaxID=505317 RepID=A0A0A3AVJ2_9PAST|nr:ABC transporter permease [Chelonobacter oris]